MNQNFARCLLLGGGSLFAAACVHANQLPVAALFVGPGLMLAGIVVRGRR